MSGAAQASASVDADPFRLQIRLPEGFVIPGGDHKRASYDDIFAELRKYYSEEQIVALGWKTGIWLGYGRLVHALDVPAVGASCAIPTKAASGSEVRFRAEPQV